MSSAESPSSSAGALENALILPGNFAEFTYQRDEQDQIIIIDKLNKQRPAIIVASNIEHFEFDDVTISRAEIEALAPSKIAHAQPAENLAETNLESSEPDLETVEAAETDMETVTDENSQPPTDLEQSSEQIIDAQENNIDDVAQIAANTGLVVDGEASEDDDLLAILEQEFASNAKYS